MYTVELNLKIYCFVIITLKRPHVVHIVLPCQLVKFGYSNLDTIYKSEQIGQLHCKLHQNLALWIVHLRELFKRKIVSFRHVIMIRIKRPFFFSE